MLRSSENTWRLLLPRVPSSQGRARLCRALSLVTQGVGTCLLLQAWLAGRTCLERRPCQRRKGDISSEGCSASPAGPAGSPTAQAAEPGELLHFLTCFFGLFVAAVCGVGEIRNVFLGQGKAWC